MEDSGGRYGVDLTGVRPVPDAGQVHEYGMEFQGGTACPGGDTCTKNIRTDGRAAWAARRRGGRQPVRLRLLPQRRPGRVVHLAGVREDEVPDQGGRAGRLGPAGPEPAELGQDPLRRLDLVAGRRHHLAERRRRLLDPGGELRHGRLRPRAQPHPGHRRQLQQPVRRAAAPRVHRHLGDAQPGQLQRPRRPAQPLADPADRRRLDGRRSTCCATRSSWRWSTSRTCCGCPARRWPSRAWSWPRSPPGRRSRARAGCPASTSRFGDRRPAARPAASQTDPLCDGGGYNNYTVEVVDRMGADSFTPDSGVLLAKTKNEDRAPFEWVVDANPQDIDMTDYVLPDGTTVPITIGDYRQLSDALFHAGTDSGSEYEYVDEANRLHFYVTRPASATARASCRTRWRSARWTARARSKRGVKVLPAAGMPDRQGLSTCTFPLPNTGKAAPAAGAAPRGRQRLPQVRRLPPVGRGGGQGLDGPAAQRARHRRRPASSTAGRRSTPSAPGRQPARQGQAHRDLGERPHQAATGRRPPVQ